MSNLRERMLRKAKLKKLNKSVIKTVGLDVEKDTLKEDVDLIKSTTEIFNFDKCDFRSDNNDKLAYKSDAQLIFCKMYRKAEDESRKNSRLNPKTLRYEEEIEYTELLKRAISRIEGAMFYLNDNRGCDELGPGKIESPKGLYWAYNWDQWIQVLNEYFDDWRLRLNRGPETEHYDSSDFLSLLPDCRPLT